MNDDTLARVRRVVAGLREAMATGGYGDYIGDLDNAAPALLALGEAVGRLAGTRNWQYREVGPTDEVVECSVCGAEELTNEPARVFPHEADCPALAIDAALADLAALAGDADAGGIAQSDPDGGVHHLRNMSDIVRDAGEVG